MAGLVSILLMGCKTIPQVGTYYMETGKFGTSTLIVRSNGTFSERYGPVRLRGTWVPVTNMIIKAQIQEPKMRPSTRLYSLDKATGSFQWGYRLDDLIGDQAHKTVEATTNAVPHF